MQPDANELTRARAAVSALWRRAQREVAFELARWALVLRNDR